MTTLAFVAQLERYARPYRGPMLLILLGMTIELCYEVGLRYSLKFIVDAILNHNVHIFLAVFAMLGAGGLLYTVFCITCDYYWARYGAAIINDIRFDLFRHMQKLPIGYLDRSVTGDLVAHFTSDSSVIDDALVIALPAAFLSIGELVISSAVLLNLNALLFGGTVAGIVISLASPLLLSESTRSANYALRKYTGRIAGFLQEHLSRYKIIRAYGLESRVVDEFGTRLKRFLTVATRAYYLSYVSQRLPNLSFLILNVLVMLAGGWLAMGGKMSVGTLVSFQVIFMGISAAINHISWIIPSLATAAAAMQRVRELLDTPPVVAESSGSFISPQLNTTVEFRNVSFAHTPDKPTLHELSFAIAPRSFVAFVGPSGAGKTTVANLLLRFYEGYSGEILIDGVDLSCAGATALRKQIGLVSQDVVLFDMSIAENIQLGDPAADPRDVENAARAAQIHDFIISLPDQYNTRCGESGVMLSGGERQRIALARALVRKPALLLLDEVTSALDPLSEQRVCQVLRALRGQCTIIAITHKLKLAADADLIFVMHQGTIVERGTHGDLLKAGGLYSKFWEIGADAALP